MPETQQENIQAEAEAAVETDRDIRAQVRDITLRALSQRSLSVGEVADVVRAVTEGVSTGLGKRAGEVKDAAQQALAGLDDAIKKSAEATKLAAEQLLSQGKEFKSQDLKPAMEELKQLEEAFLSTVSKVTDAAGGRIKAEFSSQINHIRRTGTDSGRLVADTVADFNKRAGSATLEGVKQGLGAAMEIKQRLTLLASGILAGMADVLHDKATQGRNKKAH